MTIDKNFARTRFWVLQSTRRKRAGLILSPGRKAMERIAKAITTTLCRKTFLMAADQIDAAAGEWFAGDVRTIHRRICHTKTSLRLLNPPDGTSSPHGLPAW